jgi:hypothetical protein
MDKFLSGLTDEKISRRHVFGYLRESLKTIAAVAVVAHTLSPSGLAARKLAKNHTPSAPVAPPRPLTETPLTKPLEKEHRVLCLDGGGTIAAQFEIKTLIEIFGPTAKGWDVLQRFDEVVATSAGGIILAGLISNYTLDEVRKMSESKNFLKSLYAERENHFIQDLFLGTGKEVNDVKQTSASSAENKFDYGKNLPWYYRLTMKGIGWLADAIKFKKFSTKKRNSYFHNVISRTVEAGHSSLDDIPQMGDYDFQTDYRFKGRLADQPFDQLSKIIPRTYNGKEICITFVGEGPQGELLLMSTSDEPISMKSIGGHEVMQIDGKNTTYGQAVCTTATPLVVLYDKANLAGKIKGPDGSMIDVYGSDGGMPGFNTPTELAAILAEERGNSHKKISILSIGISGRPKDLKGYPKLFLEQAWNKTLDEPRRRSLTKACDYMKKVGGKIIRLAPDFYRSETPSMESYFMAMTSMASEQKDIDEIIRAYKAFFDGQTQIEETRASDGTSFGYSSLEKSIEGARCMVGVETQTGAARPKRAPQTKVGRRFDKWLHYAN